MSDNKDGMRRLQVWIWKSMGASLAYLVTESLVRSLRSSDCPGWNGEDEQAKANRCRSCRWPRNSLTLPRVATWCDCMDAFEGCEFAFAFAFEFEYACGKVGGRLDFMYDQSQAQEIPDQKTMNSSRFARLKNNCTVQTNNKSASGQEDLSRKKKRGINMTFTNNTM